MKLFRNDNTDGYSGTELDALNGEWELQVEQMGIDENTDEYDIQAKRFSNEVSRR